MPATREALISAMESYFGSDSKRIDHAQKVTEYAERLMGPEGGDPSVVVAAAIFHDIGIPNAEKKYGSALGKYQEAEGPPVARDILAGLGAPPAQIDEVCEIIAHHHSPGKVTTQNFKILYDADWLVNLRDQYDIRDRTKLATIIDRVFLTATGKSIARQVYLDVPQSNA